MFAAVAAGAALVLMLGFVLMYQIAYANRVYPGVRVFGHDLGGYSRDEASRVLQGSLDDLSKRSLTVTARERSWTFTAQELGLRVDLAPVLDSVFAVGREGNLLGRFSTQLGLWQQGRSFEQPSAAFDPSAQTVLLERLATEIDRPVVEASLTLTPELEIVVQDPQAGLKVDVEASRRRLQDALSMPGVSTVELVIRETAPPNAENNFALAREQATQILSGPITLQHGEKSWTLDRTQLASILRFNHQLEAKDAAYLDSTPLIDWTKTLASAVNQLPQDARLSWSGGKLEVIRPSKDGIELDVPATVEAIVSASRGGERQIALPVKVTRPAVPMEERQNLGIKELIETSRTSFAGSVAAKQANITLAAQRLNGVVVPPGGTFSFNKELGSTSLDAGFKIGWGITTAAGGNIKTVPSVAGGICQVATTLFHSVFWSGYQIEERNWHLYWIQSYTSKGVAGLDATVDEEAGLDFQFINPTKTHLLVQSWVDGNANVNFALYGTKPDWVVKVDPSVKSDVVQAETDTIVYEEEPSMPEGNRLQVERAMDGFTITNVRHVLQNGEDRTLRLVSRYRPSRNVVLVGTGGKPASGRTIVEQNVPAQVKEKPAPTPAPSPAAAPRSAPSPAPVAPASPAPPAVPPVQPTAAPTTAPARSTAAPTRPASTATAAPTPTPKKR